MQRKILVVSPHPDDAEIGVGASIRKWVNEGLHVDIAVCTGEGDLTMVHSGQVLAFEQRKQEQARASEILGVTETHLLEFSAAAQFDARPIRDLVCKFDALFKHYDTVILPLPSAAKDHQVVHEAGLAAFRQGKLDKVTLFAYEQPMQHHGAQVPSTGQVYVQVSSDDMLTKLQSIAQHESQFAAREGYGLYTRESLLALATVRGAETGAQYAEMLYLIRGRYESLV